MDTKFSVAIHVLAMISEERDRELSSQDLAASVGTNASHIRPDQVLVKVTAAGVNPVDNMITRGEVKMVVSYVTPLTAGNELVGRVEEVGSEVRSFNVGDRVFGRLPLDSIGAFAKYAAVDATALATVPGHLSDDEARRHPVDGADGHAGP